MKFTSSHISNIIAVLALIVSGVALTISWNEYRRDYSETVLIQPGMLPVREIKLGENSLELVVQNTSKSNVQYYIRVNSNVGFIDGQGNKPQMTSGGYESQVISLGKSGLPNSSFSHQLVLDAGDSEPDMHPQAYLSDPEYYLSVEILNARNGKSLFSSTCYYMFHRASQSYGLEQPVVDTTGESARRQAGCRS